MLGQLLGVIAEFLLQRVILGQRLAPRPGSGDRADGNLLLPHPYQNFRACPDDAEIAHVQVEHKRRRIDPAQGAVKGGRRQVEIGLKPLGQDDLIHYKILSD